MPTKGTILLCLNAGAPESTTTLNGGDEGLKKLFSVSDPSPSDVDETDVSYVVWILLLNRSRSPSTRLYTRVSFDMSVKGENLSD